VQFRRSVKDACKVDKSLGPLPVRLSDLAHAALSCALDMAVRLDANKEIH
jgi:hypothetical protein